MSKVNYPGLPLNPDYDLAERQHLGAHGAVLSFELVGCEDAAKTFLAEVRLCTLIEHVGSVHTLLTHPASMTHVDVPPAQRAAIGIGDGLVRLSVGLEAVPDIVADLDQALRKAHRTQYAAYAP